MVVGIVAVVLAIIPVIGTVSFLLGAIAIVLGVVAIWKKLGKGQGIAGVITGAVSVVVALVVMVIVNAAVSVVDQGLQGLKDDLQEELGGIDEEVNEDLETAEQGAVPDTPQAYSTLTIIGDEDALPEGDDNEISIVAMSEPTSNTSFPFILQNRSDQAISRVEVSGRAIDTNDETLGTGSSHSIYPNVVLPGGYAFGYVYVDSSDHNLPAGASIPDLNIDFTEGLGQFENIIGLDIENFEELGNGDLTGDVTNPHEMTVDGPINIDTVCLSPDGQLTYDSAFADNDSVKADAASTWTISSYSETPECEVRLLSSSGFE